MEKEYAIKIEGKKIGFGRRAHIRENHPGEKLYWKIPSQENLKVKQPWRGKDPGKKPRGKDQ